MVLSISLRYLVMRADYLEENRCSRNAQTELALQDNRQIHSG